MYFRAFALKYIYIEVFSYLSNQNFYFFLVNNITQDTGYAVIQTAIDSSVNGDTIIVSSGTCAPDRQEIINNGNNMNGI